MSPIDHRSRCVEAVGGILATGNIGPPGAGGNGLWRNGSDNDTPNSWAGCWLPGNLGRKWDDPDARPPNPEPEPEGPDSTLCVSSLGSRRLS